MKYFQLARKYDIALSTVQASYTSKCVRFVVALPMETYRTKRSLNALSVDIQTMLITKNRVTVTVLRDLLLKQLGNGAYEPRKLKREKVKDVLLSFRRTLMDKSDGERGENNDFNIFDYV